MNSRDEHDDAIRTHHRRVAVIDVDDTGPQQRVHLSGFKSEELKRVVRSQHHGLSSVPPKGAEGVLVQHGHRSDRTHVLGLEHPQYRPTGYQPGDTVLYDAHGNAISLVKQNIRVVGADTITMQAKTIIFDCSDIRMGGAGANRPMSAQGTIDSCGCIDTSNFSTAVKTT